MNRRKKSQEEAPQEREPTFEEALERLEELVTRLEDGEITLEESVQAYAEGMRLVRLCLARLEKAEATIRELTETAEGFSLEPFSSEPGKGEDVEEGRD